MSITPLAPVAESLPTREALEEDSPSASGDRPGASVRWPASGRTGMFKTARDVLLAAVVLVIFTGSTLDIARFLTGDEAAAEPTTPAASNPTPYSPGTADAGESVTSVGAARAAETRSYTVVRGDMLYEIARRHDTSVQALAALNRIANPDRIEVGQVLSLPESSESDPR